MPALLALLIAAAPAHASLVGIYEIHQMEMAGGIELRADGRFRYAFSYGAVDEEGEGEWKRDGQNVVLTSSPMPQEPTFEIVKDVPAPPCTLTVAVDWGKFGWNSPPNALVTYPDSPTELHFVQADENGALHPDKCPIHSLLPLVPMFDTPGAPLNLSPATGHNLSLRFVPNDLGRVAFRAEPLRIEGPALVMKRYDAEIRFLPRRP